MMSGEPSESTSSGLTEVRAILPGCVANLKSVYLADRALFPYISLLQNGALVNDYRLPGSLRYSVNTLLGLNSAARAGGLGVSTAEVDAMVAQFAQVNARALDDVADLGLYVLLLVESGWSGAGEAARSALARLTTLVEGRQPQSFVMQDLAWLVWGAAAASRVGIAGADELGRSATALVKSHFVDEHSRLPRHSCRRYRQRVVSFGAFAYFLRAMWEAGDAFGDDEAAELFGLGVTHAVSIQGPQGEWPWMIDVRTGRPFDPYPVFSVHQDSMALLFLHPALDDGRADVDAAVTRSLAWGFGHNELGIRFYLEDPLFFAYRSIERAESMPRLRRYLRFLSYAVLQRPTTFAAGRGVRLNPECRSYHLGWILFVWSERLASQPDLGPAATP